MLRNVSGLLGVLTKIICSIQLGVLGVRKCFRAVGGVKNYFCTFFRCSVGVRIVVFNTGDHNHPSDLARNARELIKLKMVEQCAMDPSVPPRRVYDNVCDNVSSEDSDSVPTFRFLDATTFYKKTQVRL